MRIKLEYPIERKMSSFMSNFSAVLRERAPTIKITHIEIRRPRAEDMIDLDFSSSPSVLYSNLSLLLSRITNISLEEVMMLDLVDFKRMSDIVGEMMGTSGARL